MNLCTVGTLIDCFVREKKMRGYSFRVQERWMRQFKEFASEHADGGELSLLELMEGFCVRNPGESTAVKQQRRCLMGQYASYLTKHGVETPSPEPLDKYFTYPKRVPYIFSNQELASIFRQIDCWKTTPQSRSHRTAMDPLIFRMAYGCGMRIMEILTLRCRDVDSESLAIHVRSGKNGRERRIPMAESLARRCVEYANAMHVGLGGEGYFYPGRKADSHASYEAAQRRFKEYLWKAGIARTDKGPVIHDLRHTYCVHRLKEWVLSGTDIENLLPYMSAFLGHADFRGTEYYLRLTADLYPEIVSKMEEMHGAVIPVWAGTAKIPGLWGGEDA